MLRRGVLERQCIPDVILVKPRRIQDARGWLSETFRASLWEDLGVTHGFVQENHAATGQRMTLRGLHLQVGAAAQAKLVRVLRGAIFDVAVDVRSDSAFYGQHVAVRLDAAEGAQLYIPAGFAHGYLTLEPDTEVAYRMSAYYAPEAECGVHYADPMLAIPWPLGGATPLLSEKDAQLPMLSAGPLSRG